MVIVICDFMRILITGITGLIGSHLAEFLVTEEHTVYGIVRTRGNTQNISHLKKARIIEGDVEDAEAVRSALRTSDPEIIFHLAAQSYPNASWEAPLKTLTINIASTVHILENVRKAAPEAKVLIACSAAEYGSRGEGYPLKGQAFNPGDRIMEDAALRPVHPYGVSKVAQELLGHQYFTNFGIRTYLPRFFNQAGPRQGDRTALQSWAKQIVEIERENNELRMMNDRKIKVGNLETVRDFLDVRDGVRAMWALVTKGKPGEPYNVCSGKGYRMGELLETLLSLARFPVMAEVDIRRLRLADEPRIVGNHDKLTKDTEWKPAIPIEETLKSILEYWRHQNFS